MRSRKEIRSSGYGNYRLGGTAGIAVWVSVLAACQAMGKPTDTSPGNAGRAGAVPAAIDFAGKFINQLPRCVLLRKTGSSLSM